MGGRAQADWLHAVPKVRQPRPQPHLRPVALDVQARPPRHQPRLLRPPPLQPLTAASRPRRRPNRVIRASISTDGSRCGAHEFGASCPASGVSCRPRSWPAPRSVVGGLVRRRRAGRDRAPLAGKPSLTAVVMRSVSSARRSSAAAWSMSPLATASSRRVVASATRASMTACGSTPLAVATSASVWPPSSARAQVVLGDADRRRRRLQREAAAATVAAPVAAGAAGTTPAAPPRPGVLQRLDDGVELGLGDRAGVDERLQDLGEARGDLGRHVGRCVVGAVGAVGRRRSWPASSWWCVPSSSDWATATIGAIRMAPAPRAAAPPARRRVLRFIGKGPSVWRAAGRRVVLPRSSSGRGKAEVSHRFDSPPPASSQPTPSDVRAWRHGPAQRPPRSARDVRARPPRRVPGHALGGRCRRQGRQEDLRVLRVRRPTDDRRQAARVGRPRPQRPRRRPTATGSAATGG